MKLKILMGLQRLLGFALSLIGIIIFLNISIMESWRYFMGFLALILVVFLMPFAFIFGFIFLFSKDFILFDTDFNNVEPTPTPISQKNQSSNYNEVVKQKIEGPIINVTSVVSKLEVKSQNGEFQKNEKYFENYNRKNHNEYDDVEDHNNLSNTSNLGGFDTEFGYVDLDYIQEEMENEKALLELEYLEKLENEQPHAGDFLDDPYDED
jgi:hypothetical protein